VAARRVIRGFPISSGICLGTARVIPPGETLVAEVVVSASKTDAEILALDRAVEVTVEELRSLRRAANRKAGGPVAKIFDAQLLIAQDGEFLKEVRREIRQRRRNAGFIYNQLVRRNLAPLKKSRDRYMRQTADDIENVAQRILSHLSGNDRCDLDFPRDTILVGKNFGPADLLNYRRRNSIGFVVSEGGNDSHMALIARSLMLPVVQASRAWSRISNESRIVVDGSAGRVIVEPTDEEWAEFQKLRNRQGPALVKRIKRLSTIPPKTLDGIRVGVAANVSLPGPADDIVAERGIPVGLYRTEFMYLAAGEYPDEETQFEQYRQIAEKFAPGWVNIRTFDLGYDKVASNGDWPDEANPALGWRGIRATLDMGDVFKIQIRAILRASMFGDVRIMLPMISTVTEINRARRLISQAKLSLRRQEIPYRSDVKLGIMVEVPSAALLAPALARKVDFMSIGTNDLTQYTMAADRTNRRVATLYNPLHPAVLGLIQMAVQACRKQRIPISICGEIAGDILALPLFIGMGVDLLSMSPNRLVDVCRAVKKIDSRLVRHLVGPVVASDSLRSVKRKLENFRAELEK